MSEGLEKGQRDQEKAQKRKWSVGKGRCDQEKAWKGQYDQARALEKVCVVKGGPSKQIREPEKKKRDQERAQKDQEKTQKKVGVIKRRAGNISAIKRGPTKRSA